MSKRVFFTLLIMLFTFFVYKTVGWSDNLTLVVLIGTALLMTPVVLEFQMGGRQLMANHFKKSSKITDALRTPGLLSKVLAFFAALIISFGFIILMSGIIRSHYFIPSIFILALATFIFYPLLGEDVKKSNLDVTDSHLVQSASNYAKFIATLIIGILVFNFFMALILSAKDTYIFLTSNILFSEVSEKASNIALKDNGSNYYSMAIINIYILTDTFRLAVANEVFGFVVSDGAKETYFYIFYMISFLTNLIKLAPFSVGIIFLLRGIRRYSDVSQDWTEKIYKKFEPYAKNITLAAKNKVEARIKNKNKQKNKDKTE